VASLQAYSSHGIQYYRIVESFRREGKPSIRVLAHLGRVDEILRRHQQLAEVPVRISSVSAGAVTALFGLAQELDVAGRINHALSGGGEVQVRAGLTVGESLVIAMIARACAPRSKRAFADWASTTWLPALMKFTGADLTSQHFWDQMNVMPLEKTTGDRTDAGAGSSSHRTNTATSSGLRHNQLLHPHRQHESAGGTAATGAQQAGPSALTKNDPVAFG
jgi:hypothetical protein